MALSKHDAQVIHDYVNQGERTAFLNGVNVGIQVLTKAADSDEGMEIIFDALSKYMKKSLPDNLEYWQELVELVDD